MPPFPAEIAHIFPTEKHIVDRIFSGNFDAFQGTEVTVNSVGCACHPRISRGKRPVSIATLGSNNERTPKRLKLKRQRVHRAALDFKPVVKVFTPDAQCTWLLTEIDEGTDLAFGLRDLGLGCPALGYVSVTELCTVRGKLGLPIERDLHFEAAKPIWATRCRAALRHLIVPPTTPTPAASAPVPLAPHIASSRTSNTEFASLHLGVEHPNHTIDREFSAWLSAHGRTLRI